MITDEQKVRLNELMARIEAMSSRIAKGVVQGQEAGDFFAEGIRQAKDLFENTSDEWRIIDRWEHENGYQWQHESKPGVYAGDNEKVKLEKLNKVLSSVLPSGMPQKNEFHFSVSETYDAKRFIVSIFRSAAAELTIIDEHLDDQVFDYLDVVPASVQVRIVTGDQKPIFWNLLQDLKKKNSNIDARVNKPSHCRHLVVDNSIFYSTDASINTIGKKDFMIHKLEDSDEIVKVAKEIEGYWNSGQTYIRAVRLVDGIQ